MVMEPSSDELMDRKILVEFNPLTDSCLFFVTNKHHPSILNLDIEPDKLLLRINSEECALSLPGTKFMLNSASDFTILKNKSIMFRVYTLPPVEEEVSSETHNSFIPQLKVKTPYYLFCRNCSKLAWDEPFFFHDIFEMSPSSVFYCFCQRINPEETVPMDLRYLMYRACTFKIHQLYFSKDIKLGIILCRWCKEWLGRLKKNDFILWNSCMKFCETQVYSPDPPDISFHLIDFLSLVKTACDVNPCTASLKVVLIGSTPSGGNCFLMMNILEKQLTLYSSDSSGGDFTKKRVIKLFYTIGTVIHDYWKSDLRTLYNTVSFHIIKAGVGHLLTMAKVIPQTLKEHFDQFTMSYIDLDLYK